MYAFANPQLVFEVVRTNLDRVPLSGEVTERDEDVMESPSRTVSDKQLLQYINDGQRLLTERVKALYLQSLVNTYTGPLSGFDQEDMARPLVGRVERRSSNTYYSARQRDVAEHNYLESSGRKATPKRPAYTVDGGFLEVYPNGDPTVRIDYVAYPDKFELGSDAFQPLDVSFILTGPLIMYVTAKAQRSIERIGLHDLYMNLFERLVQPFGRGWRIGRPDDYGRSRPDELEVNTEV